VARPVPGLLALTGVASVTIHNARHAVRVLLFLAFNELDAGRPWSRGQMAL